MSIRLVCVLGVLLLAACAPRQEEPGVSEVPPAAPSKITYHLGGQYKSGQVLLLTLVTEDEFRAVNQAGESENAPIGMTNTVTMMEMPVSVSRPNAAGESNVELTVRRVAMKSKYTVKQGEWIHDTDMDSDILPYDTAKYKLPIIEARYRGVMDNAGRMNSFMPDGESNDARLASAQMCAEMSYLVQRPWSYMPKNPVAVGDTWPVAQATYATPLWTMLLAMAGDPHPSYVPPTENVQCTLKELNETPHGRVATIGIAGTIKYENWGVEEDWDVEDDAITGTIRVNIDTDELLEHVVEVSVALPRSTGRMKMATTLLRLPTK